MKRHLVNSLMVVSLLIGGSAASGQSQNAGSTEEAANISRQADGAQNSNPKAVLFDAQSISTAAEPANQPRDNESSRLLAQEEIKLREGSPAAGSGDSTEDGAKSHPAARSTPPQKVPTNPSWPARLASFVCGSIAGVPVCLVRRTYYETVSGGRDIAGGHKNAIVFAAGAAFSIPYAVCGGIIEAVPCSLANSWRGSAEEPFSKDAFSLGEGE